ncbi:MAG: glycosyltransferase family 2 protein, partial [Clostridia bacterium]|nr:glycosyltransferase family 2 protein [Clostridia bacterium]
MPKVSIIVPVYNAEKYIERCVNSLKNQTLDDIEIILVDDSSTDSSLEICKKMAKEDNRIKVIHKVNEGAGYARNAALEIATGKYIGFADSDDFVEKGMFEALYEKAEKYNSELVMSGVLFVDGNMFSEKGECIRKSYFEEDTHFDTTESLKKLRMGIVGATPDDTDDSKYGMSIWKNLFKTEIIKSNNLSFQSERQMLSEDALFMI